MSGTGLSLSMLRVQIADGTEPAAPAIQFLFRDRQGTLPISGLHDSRLRRPAPASPPPPAPAVGFTSGPYLAPWQETQKRGPLEGDPMSRFLLLLHRETDMDVLSDSLSSRSPFGEIVRAGVPFEEALRQEARGRGLALALDEGVLRVRHSRFYDLRPRQIPARRMEQAIAELEPDADKMLATMTRLVAELNPGQRVTLARSWPYVWANDRIFVPARYAYRAHVDFVLPLLLARLSDPVRNRLVAGEPVRLAALSPADGRALDEALEALSEAGYDRPPYSPPPDPQVRPSHCC